MGVGDVFVYFVSSLYCLFASLELSLRARNPFEFMLLRLPIRGGLFSMKLSSMETFDPATLAQRVAELFRNNIPEGAQPGVVLGLVNRNPRIDPPASPFPSIFWPRIRICSFSSSR